MNIFAQAAQNLPLTPAQRAFLKLVEGFFWTGIVAAAQAFVQYLSPDGYVDWPAVLHTALIAGAVAFCLAVAKYYKSHGDPLIAAVATTAAQSLESTTPTLYNRAEQGAPAPETSNATGSAATVAVTSSTPATA